ncbi:hypothetical protein OUZ56_006131 [Daphnia magna]|uniref:Uncharacterized protein n=1 Tax=Daphnia magna TaxID=35525 RepID=A0ABQ9YUU8_9CRUS|nr:hypothetical protein OUZ56_006131 [Daphnia magna]
MLAASLIESLQQDKGIFSQIILCGKVRGNSEKHRHPNIMADFDIARLQEFCCGHGLQSTPLTAAPSHRSHRKRGLLSVRPRCPVQIWVDWPANNGTCWNGDTENDHASTFRY